MLKNVILRKHFIINAIGEFNNKSRVDFDEDTNEYFLEIDFDFSKNHECISYDEKINSFKMCKVKSE